jgi:hypothetical protein
MRSKTLILCAGAIISNSALAEDLPPLKPTPGHLAWRLPKTVLNVTVNYELQGCKDSITDSNLTGKDAVLDIKVTATMTPASEPDPDLGPAFPKGLVVFPVKDLHSFWQDSSLALKTYPGSRILQSLGAAAQDQTGAIIGNVISGAVKIAAVSMGVPVVPAIEGQPQPPVPKLAFCGDAARIVPQVAATRLALKNATTEQQSKDLGTQLIAQLQSITIESKTRVDPGITDTVLPLAEGRSPSTEFHPVTDGLFARIELRGDRLVKEEWIKDPDNKLKEVALAMVTVNADMHSAVPAIPELECEIDSCKVFTRRYLAPSTLFREAATVRVAMRGGNAESMKSLGPPTNIPFAQFGPPRTMRIKPKIFQTLNWTFAFDEFGQQTEFSYGTKSPGVAASSLFSSAAGGASSIASQSRNSSSALGSETIERQANIARMKALTDEVTQEILYNEMLAKGLIKEPLEERN